ncbi:hypothetical protein CR513_33810, partial [Mucuna pruriens]
MVVAPSEEVVAPFIFHGLRIQEGEYLKKIHLAWKKIVRKGPEWGLQSCGASSSYNDPQFEAMESKLVGLQRQLKRKRKELDSREGEESRGTPETKCCFRTTTQEKVLRELERSQALLEKEELIAALADARSKEDDARGYLH